MNISNEMKSLKSQSLYLHEIIKEEFKSMNKSPSDSPSSPRMPPLTTIVDGVIMHTPKAWMSEWVSEWVSEVVSDYRIEYSVIFFMEYAIVSLMQLLAGKICQSESSSYKWTREHIVESIVIFQYKTRNYSWKWIYFYLHVYKCNYNCRTNLTPSLSAPSSLCNISHFPASSSRINALLALTKSAR